MSFWFTFHTVAKISGWMFVVGLLLGILLIAR